MLIFFARASHGPVAACPQTWRNLRSPAQRPQGALFVGWPRDLTRGWSIRGTPFYTLQRPNVARIGVRVAKAYDSRHERSGSHVAHALKHMHKFGAYTRVPSRTLTASRRRPGSPLRPLRCAASVACRNAPRPDNPLVPPRRRSAAILPPPRLMLPAVAVARRAAARRVARRTGTARRLVAVEHAVRACGRASSGLALAQ